MKEVEVYRYEDKNGLGPFYNSHKDSIRLDAWRFGCDSIYTLQAWFESYGRNIDTEGYSIVKYTICKPNKSYILNEHNKLVYINEGVKGEIRFNLAWVVAREVIDDNILE